MAPLIADLGDWMRDGARRNSGADKRALAERASAWALADGQAD